jgi:hypothetical protein
LNCWRFASKWWRVPSTPSIDKMFFPCRKCFPIQRKINLECFTLDGMYLLPLLHCKFIVICLLANFCMLVKKGKKEKKGKEGPSETSQCLKGTGTH